MSLLDLAEADYARKMAEQHCSFLRHNAHADALIKKTNPDYEPPDCEEASALDGMNIINNSVLGDDAIRKLLQKQQTGDTNGDDGISYPEPERNERWLPASLRGLLYALLIIGGISLLGLLGYLIQPPPSTTPPPEYIWEFME